jgi:hypothetical protein
LDFLEYLQSKRFFLKNTTTLDMNNNVVTSLFEITLSDIRDSVVAPSTGKKYAWDIFAFMQWCRNNDPTLLTEYGAEELAALQRQDGERVKQYTTRVRQRLVILLRNCHVQPIVNLGLITPEKLIQFILSLRKQKRGKFLLSQKITGSASILTVLLALCCLLFSNVKQEAKADF